jgi:hypothetical protein
MKERIRTNKRQMRPERPLFCGMGSKPNEGFLYSAGCLTTSSQKTHSDGFLYFSGRPLEVDRRLREGFDDGAKSWLAA